MALTDDQKAMLRLLSQREQGYEDIAALMGLSLEEVRSKVSEALGELDDSEQERSESEANTEPEPTPTEPEKPAEAEAVPEPPSPPRAKGSETEEPLAEAPVPAIAAPRPKLPPTTPSRRHSIRLPADQRLLAGGLAGGVAVILILVLALSGGGSSSRPTTTSSSSGGSSGSKASNASSNSSLTGAVLKPVNGSNAKGLALFGRLKNQVALEVEAQGLEPSGAGESYAIWLARSPTSMVPIASTEVGNSGRIAAEYQVPNEVLVFLASGAFDELAITHVANAQFKSAVTKAKAEKKTPTYTGTDVLRGKVTGPIVGAAAKKRGGG